MTVTLLRFAKLHPTRISLPSADLDRYEKQAVSVSSQYCSDTKRDTHYAVHATQYVNYDAFSLLFSRPGGMVDMKGYGKSWNIVIPRQGDQFNSDKQLRDRFEPNNQLRAIVITGPNWEDKIQMFMDRSRNRGYEHLETMVDDAYEFRKWMQTHCK